MIFDLGFVVDFFKTGTYPVRRVPSRERSATGRLQAPATVEDDTIEASVQPASGEELRDPEGNYATKGQIVVSRTALGLTREGYEADFIQVAGEWYQVSSLGEWAAAAGYTRAVALLSDGPPDAVPPEPGP